MPTARRSRVIAAPADRVWDTVGDPHHLPRWWPRVSRVEAVTRDAFTQVLQTEGGKVVRADFRRAALAGARGPGVGAGARGHAVRARASASR